MDKDYTCGMNTSENLSEIDQLKQDVARLKEQMRQLTRFIHYQPAGEDDDGKPLAEHLSIMCWNITLLDPRQPGKTQISLTASQFGPSINLHDSDEKSGINLLVNNEDGPEISLNDRDRKCRLSARVDKDGIPSIQILEPDNKVAVHIGYDKGSDPLVAVEYKGEPRACIKGTEKLGVVSAVHNGGQARVSMIGQESSGEIFLLNPDMKCVVKLSTEGQHDEGFITVNHSNGKAAVIISALKEHGCVILNDRAGQMKYSLPDPKNI